MMILGKSVTQKRWATCLPASLGAPAVWGGAADPRMDYQHDHIESTFKGYTFSKGPEIYQAKLIPKRMHGDD